MIIIRYTPPNELDISGSPHSLQSLKFGFTELAEGKHVQVEFMGKTDEDPTPYDQILGQLKGVVTSGPIKVSISDNYVLIEGSKKSFDIFASFFDFDEDTPVGYHNYHDALWGHESVHPESMPLVIGVNSQ